jgi:ribosomal protein S18 acetylase RimI-like enzyme
VTAVVADLHPLDNPAWASLTGPHARFAEGTGLALRYPADVSPFMAVPPIPNSAPIPGEVWEAVAELAGPGQVVGLSGAPESFEKLPDGWEFAMRGEGVQLIATDAFDTDVDPGIEISELGAADVPDMLALVARTQPGPFLPRTYELGTYLGIRREGALIAMAGERLHPPGWTEISAVCTDAQFRGQGLATTLVRAIGRGIRERGETPMMHASAGNTNAIRLYESMGFTLRRRTAFVGLRTPE